MNKQDALDLQSRVAHLAAGRFEPALCDDGKLYHHEVEGRGLWAQRISISGIWPHRGPCEAGIQPGLRLEVWYFQGRAAQPSRKGAAAGEPVWLLAVCEAHDALTGLHTSLMPAWTQLLTSGKYAKRYVAPDAFVTRVYPHCKGIMRTIGTEPAKRLDEAIVTFFDDVAPVLTAATHQWDPENSLRQTFLSGASDEDPFEKLRASMGKR